MIDTRWLSAQAYVDWARHQGCIVTITPHSVDQRPLQAITFQAPSGSTALEIVVDMSDPLMSTTIARLDRRLGLKSYLFV